MKSAVAAFVFILGADARLAGRSQAEMQPEVVAKTLSKVEDEWKKDVTKFTECTAWNATLDCMSAPNAFKKSCGTVVNAVVKASNGVRNNIYEYMGVVCDEPTLGGGWHKDRCQSLAVSMYNKMTDDAYHNRENLNVSSLCGEYWTVFAADEKTQVEKARVAHDEQEQRLAAEQAVAAKKAAAEEKQKLAEEADRQAKEAARKAEEATARLHEKVTESVRIAAEAKKKAAEAAARNASRRKQEEATNRTVINTNATVMNVTVQPMAANVNVTVNTFTAVNTTQTAVANAASNISSQEMFRDRVRETLKKVIKVAAKSKDANKTAAPVVLSASPVNK